MQITGVFGGKKKIDRIPPSMLRATQNNLNPCIYLRLVPSNSPLLTSRLNSYKVKDHHQPINSTSMPTNQ
jgi:hypothetical protein